MRPPLVVFLVTLVSCALVGTHSLWRYIVREQLPSIVHAGMAAGTSLAAWQIFRAAVAANPASFVPDTAAVMLAIWSLSCVGAIHVYELKQRNPYDGLFPKWRKK